MTSLLKWLQKSLSKLRKTEQPKWPDNIIQAAQLKSPVDIKIAPWTVNGVFPILVNGTDVVQTKSLEEAQSKIRVIKSYLKVRGYIDIWEV